MGLIEFQTVLGRMLREHNRDDHLRGVSLEENESRYLGNLRDTTEFRFYTSVQRSWCIARATKAAHLTLSLLPPEEREQLLNEWVDSGSGAQSFFQFEADALLKFIGRHLSDRPRELIVCQFERATLRASNAANHFVAPDPSSLQRPNACLRRGSDAAIICFKVDPPHSDGPLAGLFSAGLIAMFSPGLPH